MFNAKICSILLLVVVTAVLAQTDYCRANLCEKGKKHVACENNGKFAAVCKNPEIIKISPDLRTQIVDKHNTLRNQIASGFNKFPKAARMATMIWSNELAQLAEYNVKQCEMKHDDCRSTDDFPYAGQNIAIAWWSGMKRSIEQVVNSQIDDWFNEHKDCPLSVIESYSKATTGKAYGHFTAMIQQKSTHVGCAILRSQAADGSMQQLMTCNYAFTNMKNTSVYREGPTASRCKTGTDEKFKSLCSIEEKY